MKFVCTLTKSKIGRPSVVDPTFKKLDQDPFLMSKKSFFFCSTLHLSVLSTWKYDETSLKKRNVLFSVYIEDGFQKNQNTSPLPGSATLFPIETFSIPKTFRTV